MRYSYEYKKLSLCTEVLVPGKATGSQDHITNAYTVQPCNIQTFGGDVQPCVPLWRGKKMRRYDAAGACMVRRYPCLRLFSQPACALSSGGQKR